MEKNIAAQLSGKICTCDFKVNCPFKKEHLRLKKRTENTMPTPRPVTAKKKRKDEWLNYTFKWLKYWGNVIMSDPEKKTAGVDVNLS